MAAQLQALVPYTSILLASPSSICSLSFYHPEYLEIQQGSGATAAPARVKQRSRVAMAATWTFKSGTNLFGLQKEFSLPLPR